MSRWLSPWPLAVAALLLASCGEAHPGQPNPAQHADKLCENFRPPGHPEASVVVIMPTSLEDVNRALEFAGKPALPEFDETEPLGFIARCSYDTSPIEPGQTSVCPNGEVVTHDVPDFYLVTPSGAAIEDPTTGTGPSEPPCD